jgi:hypothetical protein
MIRFFIDQFRNAPGPFKKSRLLIADISDEIIDMAKAYISPEIEENVFSETVAQSEVSSKKESKKDSEETSQKEKSNKPQKTKPANTRKNPKFEAAIKDPKNTKKQQFKVLSILFDVKMKNMGPTTGKDLSKHGKDVLGIIIAPENIRKIIRLKLGDYITIETYGTGTHTAYKYILTNDGEKYFTTTYLQ